jgi:signal transduction histidine kinase
VSKIVQFPLPSPAPRPSAHIATSLLDDPPPHTHVVQFYDDETFLFETVALFLRSGLEVGEAALMIARPRHLDGILQALGRATYESAADSNRLVLIDAEALLARLTVGDELVESFLTDALARVFASFAATPRAHPGIRVFGEMVDLLWERGQPAAAIRLEELWCDIVSRHPQLSVVCSYSMRDFYKSDATSGFGDVCRLHTHVLPTERFSHEADGFERLRHISLLEQRARLLDNEVQYREELERALRRALDERTQLEAELRACQRRQRDDLIVARASNTYNELLVRMLDPLNTLLETTRLLARPSDVSLDSRGIERVSAIVERVQLSFESILDEARVRFSSQADVVARCQRDVSSVVTQAVEELRRAHQGVRFELIAQTHCFAPLDAERFRHVVLELGRHAVELTERAEPITVQVAEEATEVVVRVQHRGKPLPPELCESFSVPSRTSSRGPSWRAAGLDPGLFVANLIVTGHGGRLDLSSTTEGKTVIVARLPRRRRAV